MSFDLSGLLFGAVGGGLVSLALRVIETHWIAPSFAESRQLRRTLLKYARPLAASCDEAEYRIDRILKQSARGEPIAFACSPRDAKSLDWFIRDGYYITSTAYLVSNVFAWIVLFQRDVVFLRFRRKSLSTRFFEQIRTLKVTLSTGTFLWYYYLDGIGEKLIPEGADRPMQLSQFSERLLKDTSYLQFYDLLFEFLRRVAGGEFINVLGEVLQSLRDVKLFLQQHGAVPDVMLQVRVAHH